ncbi:MAG: helix-turn-helix domain-containing protein [Candidatus Izemoplasmataceae bacterium]
MNVGKIVSVVEKKLKSRKGESNLLGEIIKRERLKNGYTQELLADRSSISYYSKVENNKIKPSEFFVKEIGERLGLDLTSVAPDAVNDELYESILQYFFYRDIQSLNQLKVNFTLPSQTTVFCTIEACINIISKDLPVAKKNLDELETVINTLDEPVLQLFVILSAIYTFSIGNYKETIQLLNVTELMDNLSLKLQPFQKHYFYLSYQLLNLKTNSMPYYYEAIMLHKANYQTHLQVELELYRLLFALKESPEAIKLKIEKFNINHVPESHLNQYHYLNALLNYHIRNDQAFSRSIKDILKLNHRNEWFYKAIVLTHDYEKNYRINLAINYKALIENIPNDFRFILEKLYYNYRKLKTERDKRIFLKEIAIPEAKTRQSIEYLDFYHDELLAIYSKATRYKDALSSRRTYQYYLEKLVEINK